MMPGPSALASQVTAATALLLVLLLIDGCVAGTQKVGGLDAWAVPPASRPDVYLRWGKSAHVRLGDSLMFLYPPGHDDVVQVTARAAARCSVKAPLLRLADGNSVFNLTAPGRVYYTSTLPGHCRKGQRLSLDVPAANGTYLPPSADDLAALASLAKLPPAAAPTKALPTLASLDDDESGAAPPAAGASVIAVAALCFALLVYKET
ncbi:early nodulin-like protein 1 [Lolium rigidum]|uniref:early nodulin-like protein 1 n=1 Tax=Lolium rigidum TaxID=89674 RepID=UPI001F5DD71D|nr:early nodulin-like protein 1 [Lolium rigidum]